MMYTIIRVNLNIMLRKEVRHKRLYYFIPLILDVQKRQIYRESKSVVACGWG